MAIRSLQLRFLDLVFVMLFVVLRSPAQYAKPPETYFVTENNSMMMEGMVVTTYRDRSKVLKDTSIPRRAGSPKGFHVRTLYDLQARKQYTWDLIETSRPCGGATFSGDWGDPFAFSAQLLSEFAKGKPKVVGRETINGIAAKVEEFSGPPGQGKAKIWLDEKYGLIIKWEIIPANGPANTNLEVKQLSFARPAASVFVLPPACVKTEITGHVSSSATGSHAEMQLTMPPASESQKGAPQNAPSQESASQIGLPSGTKVRAAYKDGTVIKLKPEEQVALMFVDAITGMELGYCRTDKPCSLDELVKGVEDEDRIKPPARLSRDPNQDPNYRYTVTKPGSVQVEAIPRRLGLGGFLFYFYNTYYNPNGAASRAGPNSVEAGEGTKQLGPISIEGDTFTHYTLTP